MNSGLANGPERMPESGPYVVQTAGLGRRFLARHDDVWAVRDVSLRVPAGSFVCLIGASGSGKSTLLGLLGGLDTPTCGTVTVLGRDIGALDEDGRSDLRLASIGIVFQDNNLLDELTAVENVALPLEAAGVKPKEAESVAALALGRVGLSGLEHRLPADLSGGQCQRVGIARAVVGERQLLLADEPTGALDSENTRALFEQIHTMCQQGLTAIVATHDLTALRYADVAYELVDGQLHSRANDPTGGSYGPTALLRAS
jgi:ABC-type lipoprotein export system ATPase subunit